MGNGCYAMQNEIMMRNKIMECKSGMTGDGMR